MPTPVAVAVAAPAPAPAAGKPVVPANGAAKPPVPPAAGKPGVPAEAAGAPAVEADPVIWEGKVDGQLVKVKKSEADRLLSKGKFADKATQEAKEAIKAARAAQEQVAKREEALAAEFKKDPDAFMRKYGIDPDEHAKAKLEQKVAEGKMTQAERDAAALKAENQRLKEDQEAANKRAEAERSQQVTAQLQKRIEHELTSAAKRAGMATDSETFYAVYESLNEAFELGLLPVDAAGLQPHHADRIIEDAMARLEGAQKNLRDNALKLKGQALLDFVGKEGVDSIVAARLEEIRNARGIASNAPPPPANKPPARRPDAYLTPREADAQMKKLLGGGR